MKTFVLLIGLLAMWACLFSCQNPGDTGAYIPVEDDITTPTTWAKGVYVIMDSDFWVNAELTIEAGAVVKFHPDEGRNLTCGGTGVITAIGTADDPIVFTSFNDDEHGGDTNGTSTAAAAGDWSAINTNGVDGAVFSHCEFHYGGGNSYKDTVDLSDSNHVTIESCTFTDNIGSLHYGALDASGALADTVIRDCVFSHNDYPLSVSNFVSLDDSNVFANPGDAGERNGHNMIYVSDEGSIDVDVSWGETEVAFLIDSVDMWIGVDGRLTLLDGVVIKFGPDATLSCDGGIATLVNHDDAGLAFTSILDDTLKGDSNGDGAVTTPADGDWNGIYDNITTLYYSGANVRYDSH